MHLVTHFFWAFSTIRDAKCTTATTSGINAVMAQRAAQPDLKVIRSIGGWGAGGFSDVASTPTKREAFVTSCMEAFVHNGVADGFDIDWEFPVYGGLPSIGYSPEDRTNVNLLVDEFRRQLNAYADSQGRSHRDFLLTAALPAGRWEDSGDGVTGAPFDADTSFDLATLGRTLDLVMLMTYDMGTAYSPVTMVNQPLYRHPADPTGDAYNGGAEAVQYFIDHGVPRDKLVYGVEFTLSRGFLAATDLDNGLFQPWIATGCSSTTATNALNAANSTIMINWDPDTRSHFLWNPSARRFCSYEDAFSLNLRSQLAKDEGLAGIFSWEITGDSSNSQLRAVALPWEPEKVVAAPAPTVAGRTFRALVGEEFDETVATVSGSSSATLRAIVNWDDLSRSEAVVSRQGTGAYAMTGTHTYAQSGVYRLTVTIIDPDPINSRMLNSYVDANTLAGHLAGLRASVQSVGPGTSLNDIVASAERKEATGDIPGACTKLDDFDEHVRAQAGKKITTSVATELRADAAEIADRCPHGLQLTVAGQETPGRRRRLSADPTRSKLGPLVLWSGGEFGRQRRKQRGDRARRVVRHVGRDHHRGGGPNVGPAVAHCDRVARRGQHLDVVRPVTHGGDSARRMPRNAASSTSARPLSMPAGRKLQ